MTEISAPRNIKLIVYDCDGVMTDNKVIVDQNGNEYATFHRGDGLAISRIRKELDIAQIVISAETNPIILKRCEKLSIPVMNSVENKAVALKDYCKTNQIGLPDVLYIGNDINDREAMCLAGHRGCPSDAEPEILEIADWVSSKKGGDGVIRELYRILTETSNR